MPELFLELFSEEIPARMQARAADELARLCTDALAPLAPSAMRTFYGPRRLALSADVAAEVAGTSTVERGPRKTAPEQALAGFLRKHNATRDQLREEGDFLVLDRAQAGIDAADLIARELPVLIRRFSWPKSMRWGGTSALTWVRPLRRITCLLDGGVVPFDLRDGADDGHGLVASDQTEGHRFLAPGVFTVVSCAQWQHALRDRKVVADAAERRALIASQVTKIADDHQLQVVDDPGLLDELTGLVEWPKAFIGRIDDAFMDLPPEVMQVSMRINQRYFALRTHSGDAAPNFIFVANIEPADGGRTSIAGNERVLRARFADARHFWDLDRQMPLAARVDALDAVTFHAKLGSQGDRARRLVRLAAHIAEHVGADPVAAERAALLAKADLTSGMIGEFPELQGVMGRYYALHDGEPVEIADAIRDHYAPKGPSDVVPERSNSVAVALADKLDQLVAFFGIGEKPTGSGDPYALRRAALGVIRIIRERGLRMHLRDLIEAAAAPLQAKPDTPDLLAFLAERLRVQLRAEGARHDVLAAVLGVGFDDDFVRLLARTEAVAALLGTEDGTNLLAGCRRAANILRIEERRDGPHDGPIDPGLLVLAEERALHAALERVAPDVQGKLAGEDFGAAMSALASLRAPIDAFFDKVTVNDPNPDLRRNRLRLLARLRAAMNSVADFSKIEGS
ncbi:MAG TPA: glycine--tRNA ligase subunit beta [Acetobacteraceae bacterium]|jgi:glycyl-tRNA synthetase beta chain|nr:glycine--tRNA ligase subunit beta [Acetobacteraceae bacterium]